MSNIFFAYGNQQKKMKVMLKAQQEELEDKGNITTTNMNITHFLYFSFSIIPLLFAVKPS